MMSEFDSFDAELEMAFSENDGVIQREQFRKLIRLYEGCTFYIANRHTEKKDAIEFAISMLEQNQERSLIAARLQGLYKCGKVTAYKRINQALDIMMSRGRTNVCE